MKISVSQLKQFKACRRAWYLHYIEDLEPRRRSDALEVGTNYHALIEQMYNEGVVSVEAGDNSKELAMALAYGKYIFPKVKIKNAEEWLEKEVYPGIVLHGRVDGLTDNGIVVEHKTTSREIGAEYEFNLLWDEQVLAYMYLTGTRRIIYTVCRKPTIRQKKDETDEEFFERMCTWYDDDTESKIRTFDVIRTDDEVEDWLDEFIDTAKQMDGKSCYRNTLHCQSFGSECPYKSICLHYDPSLEYLEFQRREVNYGD